MGVKTGLTRSEADKIRRFLVKYPARFAGTRTGAPHPFRASALRCPEIRRREVPERPIARALSVGSATFGPRREVRRGVASHRGRGNGACVREAVSGFATGGPAPERGAVRRLSGSAVR